MQAEIIAVGTELTSGQSLDTNSQWLSQRLTALGLHVAQHCVIPDDLHANVTLFQAAGTRSDLVIVTGGLGPTQDDLTREALAKAAGVDLEYHESLFEAIRATFARRQRPMPERNRVQAYLPAGAEAIPNAIGTAPGIWMSLARAWVAALPGVPGEMKPMFEEFVVPRLRDLGLTAGATVVRAIHTFGMGESQVESQLLDLTVRGRKPEVGITASDAVITLRIVSRAPTAAEAQAQVLETESLIRQRLGSLIYGVDGEQLEDVVIRQLIELRQTIVTAESVTAGLVSRLLGRVPGASAALLGGVVAYANEVKENVLGVPESLIREHGAVSAPVVEAMAAGARRLMGSDYAVATSGIAGPTGATATKPIGLVFLGLAGPDGVTSTHVNWFGSRDEIQMRSAKSALNMLRLRLESRTQR